MERPPSDPIGNGFAHRVIDRSIWRELLIASPQKKNRFAIRGNMHHDLSSENFVYRKQDGINQFRISDAGGELKSEVGLVSLVVPPADKSDKPAEFFFPPLRTAHSSTAGFLRVQCLKTLPGDCVDYPLQQTHGIAKDRYVSIHRSWS
jgi:hypothetical protein